MCINLILKTGKPKKQFQCTKALKIVLQLKHQEETQKDENHQVGEKKIRPNKFARKQIKANATTSRLVAAQ